MKKHKKQTAQPQFYCRLCWLAKMPREIYTSHDIGNEKCSQLSLQDKKILKEMYQLNVIKNEQYSNSSDEEDIGANFGYSSNNGNDDQEEVNIRSQSISNMHYNRNEETTCNYIKPIPSQILTVFKDLNNKFPLHIELDSGASINYCEENAVLQMGFKIYYNKQVSKLGDGVTKIESVGEINEIFYRNNWTVRFKAVVCKQLSSQFIGGTVFMVDNGIEQDFSNNVIRLLNKTITVVPTDPLSLLPTAPINDKPKKVNLNKMGKLLTFNAQWLLPDQKIAVDVLMY